MVLSRFNAALPPDSGPGGRRFKSSHPEFSFYKTTARFRVSRNSGCSRFETRVNHGYRALHRSEVWRRVSLRATSSFPSSSKYLIRITSSIEYGLVIAVSFEADGESYVGLMKLRFSTVKRNRSAHAGSCPCAGAAARDREWPADFGARAHCPPRRREAERHVARFQQMGDIPFANTQYQIKYVPWP